MSLSIVIDVVAGEIVVDGEAVTETVTPVNSFNNPIADYFFREFNGKKLNDAVEALSAGMIEPSYYDSIRTQEKRDLLCDIVTTATSDKSSDTTSIIESFEAINAVSSSSNGNFSSTIRLQDGRIFMAPASAKCAIIYDPLTKTQVPTAPVPRSTTSNPYSGACLLEDGRIFCVPYASTYAAIYNPSTDSWIQTSVHNAGSSIAFWGGVVTNGGKVVCVPFGSTTVRIYDPSNNTWTTGPTHWAGSTNAFREGITLPSGKIFFVPYSATVGYIYDPVANTGSSTSAHAAGASAFSGGVFLRDGRIFCNPYSVTAPRIYDPVANTWTTAASTSGTSTSSYITCAAPLEDNNLILCIPGAGGFNTSASLQIYNITSNSFSRFGNTLSITSASVLRTISCCVMDNFNIIAAPYSSNMIEIYNVNERGSTSISSQALSQVSDIPRVVGSSNFVGGCRIGAPGDQRAFLAQYSSDTSYEFDLNTRKWTALPKISGLSANAYAFSGAVRLVDGNALCVPYNATSAVVYSFASRSFSTSLVHGGGSGAYWGGVLLPDGRVFFVPYNATRAIIVDAQGSSFIQTSTHGAGTAAFQGGVLLPDGRVFCVPYSATAAYIYDPSLDTWTTLPGHLQVTASFSGGVLLPDGRVFCVPRNATSAVIYVPDPAYPIVTTSVHGRGTTAWCGAFVDPNNSAVIKLVRRGFGTAIDTYNVANLFWSYDAANLSIFSWGSSETCIDLGSSVFVVPNHSATNRTHVINKSTNQISYYPVWHDRGYRCPIRLRTGETILIPSSPELSIIALSSNGESVIARDTTTYNYPMPFGSPSLDSSGNAFIPPCTLGWGQGIIVDGVDSLASQIQKTTVYAEPPAGINPNDKPFIFNSILSPNGKIYCFSKHGVIEYVSPTTLGGYGSYTLKNSSVSFSAGCSLTLLKDGRILCYDSGQIYIFDQSISSVRVVGTFGPSLEQGTDRVRMASYELPDGTYSNFEYKENSGCCITLPDGRVFLFSNTSGEARIYSAKNFKYITIPSTSAGETWLTWTHPKYYGATLISSDKVFLAPRYAYYGLIFDIKNLTVYKTQAWSPGQVVRDGSNMSSGCVTLNDSRILMAPGNENTIRIYDPKRPSASLTSRHSGGSSFSIDACTMTNGNAFMITRNNWALIYNPTTDAWKKTSHGNCHWTPADGFISVVPLANNRVFCVPKNSHTAWIYDGSADTWTSTRTYSGTRTDNAFWGGVLLSDGRIFCIPYSRSLGAIYNPSTGAWSDTAAHGAGSTPFRRGVLLSDGRIFCVPYTATTAGIYNPTTNAWTLTSAHGAGSNQFEGAVLLSNGKVLVANQNTSVQPRLYDIAANTWTATTIGATNGRIPVLLQNGNVFVPRQYTVSWSRIYNPTSNTTSAVGTTAMDYEVSPVGNSCLLNDGRIFMSPAATSYGRIYSPTTNNIALTSRIPELDSVDSAFLGGSLMNDGRVFLAARTSQYSSIYNPKTNAWSEVAHDGQSNNQRYCGSVTLENGNILCVPFSNASPRIYNPTSNTWTVTGTSPGVAYPYITPIKLNDGRIFCVPHSRTVGTIYNPTTNTWTDTSAHGAGTSAFWGAVQLDNDRIFCSPSSATSAYIYTISSNTWTATPAHGAGASGLKGCVLIPASFVGGSGKVFCLPYGSQSGRLYNIASNTWTSTSTCGLGNHSSGGFLLDDGRIFITAYNTTQPIIYDPKLDTYTRCGTHGSTVKAAYNSFASAIRLLDGRIFCVPHNHTRAAIYTLPPPKYSDMLQDIKFANVPDIIGLSPLFNTK